ncbi:MAG TPA: hypothetical protein PLF54_00885 [Deltaproteobacteria bacterium]|jgi:hypothetical protein|nr:hypothetical protein [Deltaproteobacteria bacterium]HQJ07524.1 hypothetical protein [Deltaproteobacteria bacterium]
MANQGLEFVEIKISRGYHELYLKPTGEILGVFMHRWDALRVGSIVDKAMQSIQRANHSSETRYLQEVRSR